MTQETEGAADAVTEDTAVADQVAEDTTQDTEDLGDDAAAAQAEGEGDKPKPRKSAQDRIDELTAKFREQEREAEFWRAKATQAPTQPAQAPAPAENSKPDPEKYDGGVYDPQYVEDLTSWKAEQAVEQRLSQRETLTRTQTALQNFDAKVREQYPDGEPDGILALRRASNVPQTIFDLVTASEIGPKLADHLGSNPGDFQRISALPAHLQGVEIARLEQRLVSPPAPSPKIATDAPAPTAQVRGAGGRFKAAPDTDDFAAFEQAYGDGGS